MSSTSHSDPSSLEKPGADNNKIYVNQLMRGQKQIILVHDNEEYTLRITSNNKLILNK